MSVSFLKLTKFAQAFFKTFFSREGRVLVDYPGICVLDSINLGLDNPWIQELLNSTFLNSAILGFMNS